MVLQYTRENMTMAKCERCHKMEEISHAQNLEWAHGEIFFCSKCRKELKNKRKKLHASSKSNKSNVKSLR